MANLFDFGDGCDLLSKMYLCRIGNNKHTFLTVLTEVVICFQKCIFVVLETTDCVYTNHNQLVIPISRIKKTSCFQT